MKLFDRIKDLTVGQFLRLQERCSMLIKQSDGSDVTVTMDELKTLSTSQSKLATEAGVGITAGTGTVYATAVSKIGGIVRTYILLDLTGLASSTTDLDIIGVAGGPAHLGQVTALRNGTVLGGTMKCLEVPAGGADDIDFYAADEGTGVFDGGIAALTETALVTAAGAWSLGEEIALGAVPGADQYLYLTGGEAGTAATYTAGKFLITLEGY